MKELFFRWNEALCSNIILENAPPWDDLRFSNTTGILPKNKNKKTTRFIGVEVEQETSATPPKKILEPPLLLASTDSDKTKSVNKDSPFEGVHKERSDC